jgi:type IV pilus assembly protein PilC
MKFHYVASNQNGALGEGNEDAASTGELLALLASRGLKPISIKQLKGSDAITYSSGFLGRKITVSDKIFLTKYLSIMLKVGIDLFQAINILLADFEKSTLRALLAEIRDNLERGQPFYATFAHYPQFFSPVFVNLVKAGEASGNLDTVFSELTDNLGKEKELRNKIRGALVYPLMLFAMSIGILLFLTTFALPKLANVFTGGGFEPPLFSRVVFGVGLFINDNIWIIIGVAILLGIAAWIFGRSLTGKRFFSALALHTPVVKKVIYNLAIQRFATTFASLLRAGVPILEALRITADTVGHPGIKASILRIADEGVAKGLTLGEAFRKETIFPFVVTNLVAISEKAGHLDEILETLGKFYEAEIDSSIKSAVAFIEPVLLLFIGAVIGTIALAIIVPVYQLVGEL